MVTADKQLLTHWAKVYTNELFSWAYYKTSDKKIAEDLVQDTFLVAIESFEKFKGNSSPKTWLFSILNHKIVDFYRKPPREISFEAGNASVFFDENENWQKDQVPKLWKEEEIHLLDDETFRTILYNCLQNLAQRTYICVFATYLEEKETKLICQELNISATNYWQILHRAKLQLRKCIESNAFKL